MSAKQQRRMGTSSLILAGIVFVAAIMVSNTLLSNVQIDLTQGKLYTISPGTRKVLSSIDEPINLYFFFSNEATRDTPSLRTYATRVREMLQEFQRVANGKLILHVLDPVRFSEAEDRATQFGLQAVTIGNQSVYFGLGATNSVGREDKIALFDPQKEAFLEYDLARLIYGLAKPNRPVVALMSGISMTAGFDQRTQRITQPWVVTEQAKQLFELRNLPDKVDKIDDDVDVLWLVQPKNVDPKTLYAIDQFILKGGRALIFVDPLAEVDPESADPQDLHQLPVNGLQPLFDAWGVAFSTHQAVADNTYALAINTGFGRRPVRHLGILGLDESALDQQDVVTSGLASVNLSTAGFFSTKKGSTSKLVPLMKSSTQAEAMPAEDFQFLSDPSTLLDHFKATGDTYVLAARLEGPVKSAFPNGAPAPTPAAAPNAAASDANAGADAPSSDPSVGSADSVNVILVGDVDMLSDRLWVQTQPFLGQQVRTAFANNGDFLVNALDNLSGSADLIGIRSKASFYRPFTTVEALRREADTRFRSTQQKLQAELTETEQKLSDLQSSRQDNNSFSMTPEQQAEVQRFMDQQVQIRSQLRTVQRNLDRSIEQLGTTLKIINIVLVPLLVALTALIVAAFQRRRHKAAGA